MQHKVKWARVNTAGPKTLVVALRWGRGRAALLGAPGAEGRRGQHRNRRWRRHLVQAGQLQRHPGQARVDDVVQASAPFSNTDPKAATAECPAGTSLIGGATMVVDNNHNPLIGVAAVSYSGPVPVFNPHTWEGAVYRTAGSSGYGLDVIAFCSAA